MSELLTIKELENILPPTPEEVLEFVDRNYGGDRSELNRIAAITALWQISTAKAQLAKDETHYGRRIEELEAQVKQCEGVINDLKDNLKHRSPELREKIDKLLRSEMITIGVDIVNAKTGQMWAFDSERLSKRIALLYPDEEAIKREERMRQALKKGE